MEENTRNMKIVIELGLKSAPVLQSTAAYYSMGGGKRQQIRETEKKKKKLVPNDRNNTLIKPHHIKIIKGYP